MLHGPWELLECSQHTMRIQTRKTWTHAHLKSCEGAHQTIAEIGMVDILSTWTACRLVTKSILWDPYIHQTNATTPDERYNTRRTLQHQPASQIQWATSRSYAHVKCEILKHKSQNQIAGIEQRCYYILNCDSQYCQYILVPIFLKRSTTWSKFFFLFFFDEWFRNEECRDPHPGRLCWARWHPRQKLKRKLMVGFLISLAIALTTCAFGLGVSCGKHWCSRGWGETRAIKLLMRDETVQWQPNWCCRTARSWRNTSVAEKVLPHHSFAIEHNNHDDLENRHWKGRS